MVNRSCVCSGPKKDDWIKMSFFVDTIMEWRDNLLHNLLYRSYFWRCFFFLLLRLSLGRVLLNFYRDFGAGRLRDKWVYWILRRGDKLKPIFIFFYFSWLIWSLSLSFSLTLFSHSLIFSLSRASLLSFLKFLSFLINLKIEQISSLLISSLTESAKKSHFRSQRKQNSQKNSEKSFPFMKTDHR